MLMLYTVSISFHNEILHILPLIDILIQTENEFDVGKHLEVEMEFKSSELNGVLLSISNQYRGSPSISIEVYNGQVISTCFCMYILNLLKFLQFRS